MTERKDLAGGGRVGEDSTKKVKGKRRRERENKENRETQREREEEVREM